MTLFHVDVARLLAPHLSMTVREVVAELTTPPDLTLGDVAFPCFGLAKAWRQAPQAIAAALASRLPVVAPVVRITAVGPYLNIHLDRALATTQLLTTIDREGEAWGGSSVGNGQTVCVDFCSPNVARRMHLGHLRSTVIGKSLVRLHEALGYRVIKINFLGDWGTQFGKLIAAWTRWGDKAAAEVDPIGELQRLYVKFHKASEADPTLLEEGRIWFRRLEEGDPSARALWTWIRAKSLASMQATLGILGVTFDDNTGEAFYEARNLLVVSQLEQLGLLTESEGAQVVPLDGMPPCLILKQDGATLYQTRDIAAALHREELYQPAKSLYVVDSGQALHFRQVFSVLAKMGLPWVGGLQHVGFGVMRVGGKRLRTRAGDVVYLADVLAQATAAARAELEVRSPGMEGADAIAQAIGVGAIIFNDLKQHRLNDIDFAPDEAISFEGETGPYVQYAHARCRSVLRKAGEPLPAPQWTADLGEEEWLLVHSLAAFPGAVHVAAERCEPHLVARALLDLAKAFNRFYHACPVLQAEPMVRSGRLALVAATARTLKQGLWMLGMEAPPMRAAV